MRRARWGGGLIVATAVAVLGACRGASPPILEGRSAAAAPTTPPPAIRWAGAPGLAVERLPAIAADGSVVVLGVRREDGGRGNPNLAIVAVDRADRVIRQEVVLAPDEADTLVDAAGPVPALVARIAQGNALLDELHRAHDLRGLPELVVPTVVGGRLDQARATGQGLVVTWQPSRVVVQRAGTTLVERPTPAAWLAPARDGCTNEAFLAGAWADPERRAAVLAIRYTGTDLCWEPDTQYHVIAW